MIHFEVYNESYQCFEQDSTGDSQHFETIETALDAIISLIAEDTHNREFTIMSNDLSTIISVFAV